MIIGNGLIAKSFQPFHAIENVVLFASGVSNSLETKESEFGREFSVLSNIVEKNPDKLIVYFSTCSIYDNSVNNSLYIQHKLKVENFLVRNAKKYLIIRLPQVVGRGGNRATVVNYLYDSISNNKCFELWTGAIRYIVDVEDVVKITSYIIKEIIDNRIVNVVSVPTKVIDIVKCIENITEKKAIYRKVNKGEMYYIPKKNINNLLINSGVKFDYNYMCKTISKYFL